MGNVPSENGLEATLELSLQNRKLSPMPSSGRKTYLGSPRSLDDTSPVATLNLPDCCCCCTFPRRRQGQVLAVSLSLMFIPRPPSPQLIGSYVTHLPAPPGPTPSIFLLPRFPLLFFPPSPPFAHFPSAPQAAHLNPLMAKGYFCTSI